MTPRQDAGEQFLCVVDGELQIKMLSPAFSQHAYQGVFEELKPTELPEDISFFKIDKVAYPLLFEVKEYIQSATLRKGDCVYVPAFYWL